MAMDGFTKDMNIIQKLNDEPNDRDGLTAGELKAKFDEGGLAVKEYLNNTVKPYVDGMETTEAEHEADTNNPHSVTKTQVGLGSVPNVSTNNQTPTYTAASSLTALVSGEKLGTAFGKLAKAVSDLISHIGNGAIHFTAAERTKLSGIETGAEVNSITGVKGNAESSYRTGNVNLTPANIGAAAASHTHGTGDITSGVLPIARGGTGQTTAKAAATSLLTSLDNGDTVMRDETLIVTSKYDGTTDVWYKRPASLLWSYVKGKADALYAAVSHKHDDRYPTLLDGTVITSSAADPADLNDATYQVPGTYNCRRAVVAATVKHTPYYDTTTLVNADMLAFILRVSYGVGTNQSISQELRTLNDGCVYYRYLQVSSGIWTAWTLVRGTASALNQHLTVNTATAQDAMYFATTAVAGETGTWYKRPASAVWNYIKTKAAAELYITAGKKSGTTLGEYATAEGYNTTASGYASHAEGNSTASGTGSHAEGSGTASGTASHAEGHDTSAIGACSHAEGTGTVAELENQHVFGKYNVRSITDVEVVGWGTANARKDIRSLATNGNEWIAGTLTQASDARLKDIQGEVPDVSGIRAVRFKWNDRKGTHDEKDHIGYIAQDVERIAPFLVGDDSNGYKSLDYIALLCAKVEWLERKVKALQEAAETEGGN